MTAMNWSHETTLLQDAVDGLEGLLVPSVPSSDEWHGWEPLSLAEFFSGMAVVREHVDWLKRPRFLDVGCGIGTKLLLANRMGFAVTGIEHIPEYVNVARRLVPVADVVEADAATWTGYGSSFDVIYVYWLAMTQQRERCLLDRIVDQVRPGTLIFAAQDDLQGGTLMGDHVWRV